MQSNITAKFMYVVLFLSLSSTARCEDALPLTVCEVLSNLDLYRGKLVTVRGVFSWTTHGWTLSETPSFQPCPEVERKGKTWPSGIYLTAFESEIYRIASILRGPRDTQREHFLKAKESLSILATFTGVLSAKASEVSRIVRKPDGSYEGQGYGQDGQYPALIACNNVQDVKLVKRGTE